MTAAVVWHDLECGRYSEDLGFWRTLAARRGDPILDVGAGTGRVSLELARAGHTVTALDLDRELLEELTERAQGLEVSTVLADAREFTLDERFALCIVPMQTIQLLGGPEGRVAFLRRARQHLREGGVVAVAIAEEPELFEVIDGSPAPLPDVVEVDGVVYSSRPTAVRSDGDGWVLERVREVVRANGQFSAEEDVIRLDQVDAAQLERDGRQAGLHPAGRALIAATDEHVSSTVVTLGA
jgi:SAM-dependent methyltransferase